jgi:Lrp/AsnC family transcriptional regulator, regulator for asnA, asnC and gidA
MGAVLVKKIELDDLDQRIIDRLAEDATLSNRKIARDFGLTEGTIRARLKRLLEAKAIRVTAVTNVARLRNPILAYLWIEVDAALHVNTVAKVLSTLPEITFVAVMLGRCDVLAMTLVEDADGLTRFLHDTIDKIPGVHRVQYTLGQQFIKHDFRWCAIVD